MKNRFFYRKGITFAEIMVTILIVSIAAIPIYFVTVNTRKDTTSAINYLRAVELANEVLDWAQVCKFEDLDKIPEAYGGYIVDAGGESCITVPLGVPTNQKWQSDKLMIDKLTYPKQYMNHCFYREIEIESLPNRENGDNISSENELSLSGVDYIKDNMLKRIRVTVYWFEKTRPTNLSKLDSKDKSKGVNIVMQSLIINDKTLTF